MANFPNLPLSVVRWNLFVDPSGCENDSKNENGSSHQICTVVELHKQHFKPLITFQLVRDYHKFTV